MSLTLCINKCEMRNIYKTCHELRCWKCCLGLKRSGKSFLSKKEKTSQDGE